jgi:hypothetical protein
MMIAVDYVTGPYIRFPILFTLPVIIASWYHGWRCGLCLAVVLPAARLGLAWYWQSLTPWTMVEDTVNALIQAMVLGVIAYLTATTMQAHRALQQQVKVLRGLLPICCFCKKIRDRDGHWQMLEVYITSHSEAAFSHGLCPSCLQEQYGEYLKTTGKPGSTF